MIELVFLVYFLIAFFAYVGSQRGWIKELIALAGVVLALFGMFQFDTLIRRTLLGNIFPDQRFYLQSLMFLIVVFFAYQNRALIGSEATRARGGEGRDPLQTRVLGAIAGGVNGYLISGTLWYFLDVNRVPGTGLYPLDPYIVAPPVGTASATFLPNLPLYLLTNNGANGDLLSLAVIVLFIGVLIMI
ncbi:CvpA family protein [bacterium]|nr:CvpA family protein [bacterium]